MSYTNETTHYGIPLPLGTDLTTPMDYNASMQALDTAVFGAVTDASAGVQKANAVEEALGTTNDNLSALTGRVTSAEGTITTQGNAITQLQLDVADTKADALDMICAVDEGTAQVASVAVQTGKYFRYNDVLYMATADIAIGDTIVPNTNCRATNVAEELQTLLGGDTPLSHVGQIIFSTTLDTEAKVIAQYGGTAWTQIEGKFILGASTDYAVESTGGEATHTLTINEIPSHSHTLPSVFAASGGGIPSSGGPIAFNGGTSGASGGGQAHNNMPPYFTTYIWHRTA